MTKFQAICPNCGTMYDTDVSCYECGEDIIEINNSISFTDKISGENIIKIEKIEGDMITDSHGYTYPIQELAEAIREGDVVIQDE